jgi:phosphohistidine phosphatase
MRVTLIRHAEAGDDAPRDEARALTEHGRRDAGRMGHGLAKHGVRFSTLASSPLVRAVQTAEIVAAAIEHEGRILVTDLLVPEGAIGRALAFIRQAAESAVDSPSVALVAHEPILSAIAAALLGMARYPPLRKSEALRIRLPHGLAGRGVARWRVDAEGRRDRYDKARGWA